jgi:Helix-turn-helix
LQIPDWCGCSTEDLPVPTPGGWWQLVPIWEPDQTATPLRRWETSRPVLGDGDMSFTATDVGRRIALLRRRLGLSQVAFARKAGISRNALVDYCS